MAYNGYLIKVNGKIFPNSKIRAETYTISPNQITDLDSYTDNDGLLRRNPLEHTASKIEFNIPYIKDSEMDEIYEILPLEGEHDGVVVDVEYYNPKKRGYQNMTAYMPTIQFTIYATTDDDITYNETRVAFIEY